MRAGKSSCEEASFSKKYHGLFERIIAPLRANDVQMTFNRKICFKSGFNYIGSERKTITHNLFQNDLNITMFR